MRSSVDTPLWPLVASKPLPRLHVLSDLHMEDGPYEIPSEIDYDILVAAGDIGTVDLAVPWLAKQGKPVVYVLGNHERWGQEMLGAVARARQLAQGTQVHVLERDSVVLRGVRFLGCTMWTDFRGLDKEFVDACARFMRDYQFTTCEGWLAEPARFKKLEAQCKRMKLSMPKPDDKGQLLLHPGVVYLEHVAARQWLKRQLQTKFRGPTVVVTHHAPSDESLRRNGITADQLKVRRWSWKDNTPAKIAAYATNGLLPAVHGERALLWVHGHTHSAVDYLEQGTRVLCNPRGRPIAPFKAQDMQTYRLFGVHLTEKDITRSQEAHAKDPFRGNGHNFDSRLVVDFEHLLQRPLTIAVQEPLVRMEELVSEVAGLLPHLRKARTVAEQCVGEAVDVRLDKLRAEVEGLGKALLSQLDKDWDVASLQSVRSPYVPNVWDPFDKRYLVAPAELVQLRERLNKTLVWAKELPDMPRRALQAWSQAGSTAVRTATGAGTNVRLRRLPASALKHLDVRELRLVAMADASAVHDPEYKLEMRLDEALNAGRVPRRWFTRIDERQPEMQFVAFKHLMAGRSVPVDDLAD